MITNGFILLHRSLLDKGWYRKADYVHVWIYLLMRANFKGSEAFISGRTIKLNPGQFIASRRTIAAATGVNENKVQRILSCFQNEHQIEQQTMSKNRVITIVNWVQYQQSEHQNEHQMNTKRTPNEHQMNTEERREQGNKGKKEPKTSYPEPQNVSGPKVIDHPKKKDAIINLILNTKKYHGVCQEEIDTWTDLYPAVDVLGELRKMAGWCEANVKNRKTAAGIKRFIVGWLGKAQDQAKTVHISQPKKPKMSKQEEADIEATLRKYGAL